MSKLEKLSNLKQLLESGAISESEFNTLKAEIIENKESPVNDGYPKKEVSNDDRFQKIILTDFRNGNNNLVKAPPIEHININNISSEDSKKIKEFVLKKHTWAPSHMSQDEVNLANKLCNHEEIAIAESERNGFNYLFHSVFSVIGGAFSAFLLSFGSCAIYFLITILGVTIYMSIYTLTRLNATRMDKIFSYIAVGLVLLAFVFFVIG